MRDAEALFEQLVALNKSALIKRARRKLSEPRRFSCAGDTRILRKMNRHDFGDLAMR